MALLDKVRRAIPITTNAYDDRLNDLIGAAKLDLGVAGVIVPEDENAMDDLVQQAIVTYCKVHFGDVGRAVDYDRLKAAYDEQKGQLSMSTGHTDWGT